MSLAEPVPDTAALSFSERIKGIKNSMAADPEHGIRSQLADAHSALAHLIERSFLTLQNELEPAIHVSRHGAVFSPAHGRGFDRLQFTHKQFGKYLTLALHWQRTGGQIAMLAEVNARNAHFGRKLDTAIELKRFNLSDPDLVTGLHRVFEEFVEQQVIAWLDRLASGSEGQTQ